MSTNNLCFEQKCEKYHSFFLSENFQFLEVKFSIYLNRHVFTIYVLSRNVKNIIVFFYLKIFSFWR